MFSKLILPFTLFVLCDGINAERLSLLGRRSSTKSALSRRTNTSSGISPLIDNQDILYLTNITLNGEPFTVTIDTGSSDLFVTSPVKGAIDQGFEAEVTYASGNAAGPVEAATLQLAGFEVPNQFFIVATSTEDQSTPGLIGLGPSSGSVIRSLGNSSTADPPLDRIFQQNTSTPNYISVLLDRSDDPFEPYPGELTIGEVLSNYTQILDQPKQNVTISSIPELQHWQVLLDENGIIGPDGKAIPITSQVNNSVDPNRATVVFDTGFTIPQVPSYVAEAIYGNITGASLQNVTGLGLIWTLPCDQDLNVTFMFSGVPFPINPLDLNFNPAEANASQLIPPGMCLGGFQPFSFNSSTSEGTFTYDMILGMGFIRNAYLLINFGDFVDGSNSTTAPPYMQMLPITNATLASEQFVQLRQNQTTSTGAPSNATTLSRVRRSLDVHGVAEASSVDKKTAACLVGAIVAGVMSVSLLATMWYIYCRQQRSSFLGQRQIQLDGGEYPSLEVQPEDVEKVYLLPYDGATSVQNSTHLHV